MDDTKHRLLLPTIITIERTRRIRAANIPLSGGVGPLMNYRYYLPVCSRKSHRNVRARTSGTFVSRRLRSRQGNRRRLCEINVSEIVVDVVDAAQSRKWNKFISAMKKRDLREETVLIVKQAGQIARYYANVSLWKKSR